MNKKIIEDNYKHLKFKDVTDLSQLKVGMMIQIVESNRHPWRWEWIELDKEKLNIMTSKWKKEMLKWIRLMDE